MGDEDLWPGDVVVGEGGSIFVPDTQSHVIRRIWPDGSVQTFAGANRHPGHADGLGPEALFTSPHDIAADAVGNLYVTDEVHAIRKITAGAMVSTIAGSAGAPGSGDGPAAIARFNRPQGLAVDAAGNVFVADMNNHTIRKISTEGTVSTIAGTAGQPGSADGIGGDARFRWPTDVAVDIEGNVYVADTGNHTIRQISPTGAVSTIVGRPGQIGFVAGALPGVVSAPRHLVLHGSTLYFVTYSGVAAVTNLH
jgi:DNA-binding beta-propeller fold protein YncE